jgi:hypothetical protein
MGRAARTVQRGLRLAFAAALAAAFAGNAPARAEDILVVYHPGFPPEAHTRAEAREAFLGEGHVWGGRDATPAIYPDTDPNQVHFVTTVLGMTPEAYDALWAAKIVREGLPAPRRMRSVRAMLDFVARTPGAVGYVRHADADAVATYGDRLDVMPWSPLPDADDGPAAGP